MNSKIKSVLFDVDGVIFNRDLAEKESLYTALSYKFTEVPQDYLEKWKKSNSFVWKKCADGVFSSEYAKYYRWQLLLKNYGILLPMDEAMVLSNYYFQLVCSRKYLVRGFERVLEECYRSNLSMGIITNGFEYVQKTKLISCKVDHYFSEVFTENNTGFRKPDIRIFQCAIDTMNVPASSVVYVGNSYDDDILPAIQVGMKAIWFDCNRKIDVENMRNIIPGLFIARNIKEVANHIQHLNYKAKV